MLIDLFADRKIPFRPCASLTDETAQLIYELKKAYMLFNEVTDPYETEALIYRMKELETRYSLLIKKAKLQKVCNNNFGGGDSEI